MRMALRPNSAVDLSNRGDGSGGKAAFAGAFSPGRAGLGCARSLTARPEFCP